MMSYQVGKRTAKQILLEYLGQKVKWNNIRGIKAIEVASHEIEENVKDFGIKWHSIRHNGSTYSRAWRKLKENGKIPEIDVINVSVVDNNSAENTWLLKTI